MKSGVYFANPSVIKNGERSLAIPNTKSTNSKTLDLNLNLPVQYQRCYIYSGLIVHPNLKMCRHGPFFKSCRKNGISFDLHKKTGTIFHLVDILVKGMIGAMYIYKYIQYHFKSQLLFTIIANKNAFFFLFFRIKTYK